MGLSTHVYLGMLTRMEGGLAAFVRRRRGDLGLTQKELADRMGVIPARVSQIETGDPKWPQTLVPVLAEALGVSQVELALAAGIITEAVPRRVELFPEDRVRRRIVARLSELTDNDAQVIQAVVDALADSRGTIVAQHGIGGPGQSGQHPAVGVGQGNPVAPTVKATDDEDAPVAL
jgi:transcriptional regulator with XRE-family HTH domain